MSLTQTALATTTTIIHRTYVYDIGNIADWLVAIGTVGTFAFAIWLFARDRFRDTRKLADEFITWIEWESHSSKSGSRFFSARVRSYNASNRPVPIAWIVQPIKPTDPKGFKYARRSFRLHQSPNITIDPQSSTSTTFGSFSDAKVDPLYAQFTDGSGRSWVREINSNKYLSHKNARLISSADSSFPA